MTHSNTQVSATTVEQLLQQDLAACRQLAELLDEELEALNGREQRQLQSLIAQKQDLLNNLEHSANLRQQWTRFLSERLNRPTEECWELLLEQLEAPQLLTQWQELKGLLAQCKQKNETNGKIIHRGQQTLRKLLGILRGQSIETPNLYNARGATSGSGGSHTVVKV